MPALEYIDDSIQWDEIESIFANKRSIQKRILNELKETPEEDYGQRIRLTYIISPVIDGPGMYERDAIDYLTKKVLKALESRDKIRDLSFSTEVIRSEGDPIGYEVYQANFSAVATELRQECDHWLDKIAEEETKVYGAPISENKKRYPFNQRGITWENIVIKFLTPEQVEIHSLGKAHKDDYVGMGFEKRGNKPDVQWALLQALAVNNGVISWTEGNGNLSHKHQVSKLSKMLKEYFQVEYDPFFPYKEKHAYEIKLKLVPSEEMLASSGYKASNIQADTMDADLSEETDELFREFSS